MDPHLELSLHPLWFPHPVSSVDLEGHSQELVPQRMQAFKVQVQEPVQELD